MPEIKDSVGEGAKNNGHDVALVQAMLKVIKTPKGTSYLTSNYDGIYGKDTKQAITSFQQDNKIIPADPKQVAIADKPGFIDKNGPTLIAMVQSLPESHKTMTIMANTKTVYLVGDAKQATASALSIRADNNLDPSFRIKVAQLVDEMYEQHNIVLTTTKDGRRRSFAEQAPIVPPNSYSGPGESNHQYGRAVDIGFRNLQWIKGDGTIYKDTDWLNGLEGISVAKANAFWDARDAIAVNKLGLFRLTMERIHLQNFDDGMVSMARSLASLLTTVGKTEWQAVPVPRSNKYKSDLGYGKGFFQVGKAIQIWNGNADVTFDMLATAKGVKVTDIKQQDVDAMKALLKADFEAADQNWNQWKPIH